MDKSLWREVKVAIFGREIFEDLRSKRTKFWQKSLPFTFVFLAVTNKPLESGLWSFSGDRSPTHPQAPYGSYHILCILTVTTTVEMVWNFQVISAECNVVENGACSNFCFWRDSPQWARASSFTKFLDHTQRRTTVCRNPLDKRSARRRDLCLITHTTDKWPCPRWDSKSQSQQASGRRPTP
jgi:hypothetical protein